MFNIYLLLLTALLFSSYAKSKNNINNGKFVGGPCEGCNAIYEYVNRNLYPVDTLAGFNILENPIKISGVIYKNDAKTPAEGVIVYVYHTNDKGRYPSNESSKVWEQRHGNLRGWIKTDKDGKYTFFTSRPASYPKTSIPQHIHITVKEPDKNEYYLEDFYFDDDPNLTDNNKNRTNSRGGKGVITLKNNGQNMEAIRNIILGLNIPNY